jgi:cytidylate kinase
MIRIITISGEFGSGAREIGAKLAERLDWKLWDEALTRRIAALARCDPSEVARREERTDPLYYRIFKAFLRGTYDTRQVGGLELLDADRIVALTDRVIREAAEKGNCVIVARGSPYFLRDRPDAFHIFVHSPYEEKVRRLRQRGSSEQEAAELIETTDRQRAEFIQKYFGMDWPSRQLYHMMISSRIGDEAVTEIVLSAISILNRQPAG